jgi:hypothetical protein
MRFHRLYGAVHHGGPVALIHCVVDFLFFLALAYGVHLWKGSKLELLLGIGGLCAFFNSRN